MALMRAAKMVSRVHATATHRVAKKCMKVNTFRKRGKLCAAKPETHEPDPKHGAVVPKRKKGAAAPARRKCRIPASNTQP